MFFQNISNQARKKLICHVLVKNCFSNVSQKFLIKIKSMRRSKIKEEAPKLALLYCARTLGSSYHRCIRKLFLNIVQYPQKIPLLESIFKKFADLQTCNFIKTRSQHRCFPVNIANFLILPILKNICKLLLCNFFNGSLLHGFKVQIV